MTWLKLTLSLTLSLSIMLSTAYFHIIPVGQLCQVEAIEYRLLLVPIQTITFVGTMLAVSSLKVVCNKDCLVFIVIDPGYTPHCLL